MRGLIRLGDAETIVQTRPSCDPAAARGHLLDHAGDRGRDTMPNLRAAWSLMSSRSPARPGERSRWSGCSSAPTAAWSRTEPTCRRSRATLASLAALADHHHRDGAISSNHKVACAWTFRACASTAIRRSTIVRMTLDGIGVSAIRLLGDRLELRSGLAERGANLNFDRRLSGQPATSAAAVAEPRATIASAKWGRP